MVRSLPRPIYPTALSRRPNRSFRTLRVNGADDVYVERKGPDRAGSLPRVQRPPRYRPPGSRLEDGLDWPSSGNRIGVTMGDLPRAVFASPYGRCSK